MRLARDTFVVSLARDTERRAAFHAQADAAGLDGWHWFDAIDGKAGHLQAHAPSWHGRPGREVHWPLLPGEVGCALSHIAIWRTMRGLMTNSLCVLEDDVEFLEPGTFGKRLQEFVRALPPHALALHLSGEVEKEPEPINDHVSRVVHTYGTNAVVYFPGALDIVLAHPEIDTMREPADWLLLPLFATGRVYCPRVPLMRHTLAKGIS
jgi:GR25 family glycosyltransferase involved in LPS biosynthesis